MVLSMQIAWWKVVLKATMVVGYIAEMFIILIASRTKWILSSRAVIAHWFSELLVIDKIYLMFRSEIFQSRKINFVFLIRNIRNVHVLTLSNWEYCRIN